MNQSKTRLFLFFFILFWIAGYCREFFFVQTNVLMYGKYYQIDTYNARPMPLVIKPLSHFSYDTLYYLKYVFTLLWMGLFFVLNYMALKKLSGEQILIRILVISYALMLCLSALVMLYGYLFHNRLQDDEYTFSRWLLGIAQSPLIGLILLASEKLYQARPLTAEEAE